MHAFFTPYIRVLLTCSCNYTTTDCWASDTEGYLTFVRMELQCSCPVYELKLIYQCSVNGGINTVWDGPDFRCPTSSNEIVLRHSQFIGNSEVIECNDGDIIGQTLFLHNGFYTSQLNITIENGLNSTAIICSKEDVTSGLNKIGTKFTYGKTS